MVAALRAAWALLFGFGLIMLGGGLQGSLLGVRADLEDFPTYMTGFFMSFYYVGYLGGSTICPRWLKQVGHVRVFAAMASLASISVLLHHMIVDPMAWVFLRLISGFCYASIYVVCESWLNDISNNDNRGQLLASYSIVAMGGSALGQLFLGYADPEDFQLFTIISVLVSLGLVPITLTVARVPNVAEPRTVGLKRLYAISPLGFVGMMLTGASSGALYMMTAVYAQKIGFSTKEISYFLLATFGGAMVMAMPIGKLSDVLDRRKVILLVTVATCIACLPLGLDLIDQHEQRWLMYLSTAAVGGFVFPMYSLFLSHTHDHLEMDERIGASATMVLINGIGAIFGPFLASIAMGDTHPYGLYLFNGIMALVIAIFTVWRMTRRAPVPAEDQSQYTYVDPTSTVVVADMYEEEQIALAEEDEESEALELAELMALSLANARKQD